MRYMALLFSVFLTGCFASNPTKVPLNYTLDSQSNKGLAVISLVNQFEGFDPSERHWYYGSKVHYQNKATAKQEVIEVHGILMTPAEGMVSLADRRDFNGNPYGVLVVKELDEGEYTIYPPEPVMLGTQFSRPNRKTSFTIKSGAITYLGEYGIHVKGSLPQVFIKDKRSRDLNYLREKYPNINTSEIIYAVNKLDKTGVSGRVTPREQIIYVPGVRYKK